MIAKLSKDRRITLPKEFIEDNNILVNAQYDISYDGNSIILTLAQDVSDTLTYNNNSNTIVSNLKEGQNYTRKVYSPCKLLIRTKKKYVDSACDKCKGKLVENASEDIKNSCSYCSIMPKDKESVKQDLNTLNQNTTCINELKSNIDILNKTLDKKLRTTKNKKNARYI